MKLKHLTMLEFKEPPFVNRFRMTYFVTDQNGTFRSCEFCVWIHTQCRSCHTSAHHCWNQSHLEPSPSIRDFISFLLSCPHLKEVESYALKRSADYRSHDTMPTQSQLQQDECLIKALNTNTWTQLERLASDTIETHTDVEKLTYALKI